MSHSQETVSRRRALALLAALGVSAPVALEVFAQARHLVTLEGLRDAARLLDQDYPDERLSVIATALQRNLDQFQIVRDLAIDDLVEPATTFKAEVD